MWPLTFTVTERNGISRTNETISVGIPLPKGAIDSVKGLALSSGNTSLLSQFKPLSFWPDNSIRWVLTTFQVSVGANETIGVKLDNTGASGLETSLSASLSNGSLSITTGKIHTVFESSLSWITNDIASAFQFNSSSGENCSTRFKQAWQIVDEGPVKITVCADGEWLESDGSALANFQCNISFFNDCDRIEVEMGVHNPKRALHPGGLWDLGDPGSIHFKSLTLNTRLSDSDKSSCFIQAESKTASIQLSKPEFSLMQHSSGGVNWNSKNHIAADGSLQVEKKGYSLEIPEQTSVNGDRAEPQFVWQGDDAYFSCELNRFWQNFPSALELKDREISIGLFPSTAHPYELQGGERKFQTAFLSYSKDSEGQLGAQPLQPVIPRNLYAQANAFPWFSEDSLSSEMEAFINHGVDGDSNFINKREVIDEYGWRNYGDIFADHETLYQSSEEPPFISHYNNQYDGIYGFARQFALTGDQRWHEMMDDLALHVGDIDIYHTDQDRAEYNNGLFWHTDHYLDAKTATHRTYTKHNDTSSTPGQTGGGPASEHCYSSGLVYHYFMTGNQRSRDAVLELANWMVALHEGTGGLLEQVLSLKKSELPAFKALLKGNTVSSHRYPFTRGTGNYINALLDAWLITNDNQWLSRVDNIIESTINPNDDFDARDLLDAEFRWSYLVLLASIAKYLTLKQEQGSFDRGYDYALASFTTYARWILNNEQMFLEQPDQLEFPNETWTAQDIRKSMLLYQAMHFDPANAKEYKSKADDWYSYIIDRLSKSDESRYARIMIILMLNHGPRDLSNKTLDFTHTFNENSVAEWKAPVLNWADLTKRITKKLLVGLISFRPQKESKWIKTRLNKL